MNSSVLEVQPPHRNGLIHDSRLTEIIRAGKAEEHKLKQEVEELKYERKNLMEKLKLFIVSNAELRDTVDELRQQVSEQDQQLREIRECQRQLESEKRLMAQEIKSSSVAQTLLRQQFDKLKLMSSSSVSENARTDVIDEAEPRCPTIGETTYNTMQMIPSHGETITIESCR